MCFRRSRPAPSLPRKRILPFLRLSAIMVVYPFHGWESILPPVGLSSFQVTPRRGANHDGATEEGNLCECHHTTHHGPRAAYAGAVGRAVAKPLVSSHLSLVAVLNRREHAAHRANDQRHQVLQCTGGKRCLTASTTPAIAPRNIAQDTGEHQHAKVIVRRFFATTCLGRHYEVHAEPGRNAGCTQPSEHSPSGPGA